ncbi:MAG: tetratricopeptide repeat protein, partial [Wenzhouxiangella sp.]|nr:tetratricopeptide repeat protein [Wenzhouxiangella sp.]
QQRYDEGEAMIRRLLTEVENRYGETHQHYLLLSYNLTELLNILGRFDEALAQAERTTDLMREVLGQGHPFVRLSESNRAQSLAGLGRGDEALALHEQARSAVIAAMGFDHPYSLTVRRQAIESRERLAPGSVPEADILTLIETYIRQTSAEHPETRKARALMNRS